MGHFIMGQATRLRSIMPLGLVALGVVIFVSLGAAREARAENQQDYYMYQYGGFGEAGDLTLETESAFGTRETRLLDEDAFEQAIRARVSGTRWLSIEGWAGMIFRSEDDDEAAEVVDAEDVEEAEDEESNTDAAFAVDLYARVLNQERQAVNLSLGAGYLYDYQQTSIPRFHVKVDREWGKLDAAFSVLGEIPLGEDEEEEEAEAQAGVNGLEEEDEEEEGEYDEIDLVLSAGASYQVADWSRLGAEAEMEDMEGFWEDDEAEGGAKLLLGPTATFAFLDNAHARVNVAGIIPLTSNDQTRVPGDQNTNKSGVMARAALGYTFR